MPVDYCVVFLERLQKFFSADCNRGRLGMGTYYLRNDVSPSSMDNNPNSNVLSLADVTKIGEIEDAKVSDNKDNESVIKEVSNEYVHLR